MFKNIAIFFLICFTGVLLYYWATQQKLSLQGLEGKTEKTIVGSLTIPITSTGEIRPSRRIEIKAEASGEIIAIHKQPGDRVRQNELLVQVKRDNEERSVRRATQDLNLAEARLKSASVSLEKLKTSDLKIAESQVRETAESVKLSRFQLDKFKALGESEISPEELLQRETSLNRLVEQHEQAKQRVEGVKISVPQAEQEVVQAQASLEAAKTNLGDAQERLAKTDIVSPVDGIVGDIPRQIGEIIQSGTTTFTGGSVLAVILSVERMSVRAEVDEADIGRVLAIAPEWAKPGVDSSVEMPSDVTALRKSMDHLPSITVEACRGERFEGVIERIYPEPRTASSVTTYSVDVLVISENRSKLLPGMRAEVGFTSERVDNVVLVPNEAIREGPTGKLGVFVPKAGAPAQDKATEFVACEFGLDNGNYSEVRSGLVEGLVVYTKLPVKQEEREGKTKKRS